MTNEEIKNAIHCMKVMIDEEVCEECALYGTTGTDHCEADCVRVAIKALEQQPILDRLKVDVENEIRFWQEPSKHGNADKRVRDAKVSSYKHMLELIDSLLAESVET